MFEQQIVFKTFCCITRCSNAYVAPALWLVRMDLYKMFRTKINSIFKTRIITQVQFLTTLIMVEEYSNIPTNSATTLVGGIKLVSHFNSLQWLYGNPKDDSHFNSLRWLHGYPKEELLLLLQDALWKKKAHLLRIIYSYASKQNNA